MVDAGEIYHPLRWTPAEAFQLLNDVPRLEAAGVIVRVPTAWRANRPPRPQVTGAVGGKPPSGLGTDALLDFTMGVSLDGEPLSNAERRVPRLPSFGAFCGVRARAKCMTATPIPRKSAIGVKAEAPCSQLLGAMSSGSKNRCSLVGSARVTYTRLLNQVLGSRGDNRRDRNGDNGLRVT